MMALDLSTDRPWWKEPMVWLIAGLPATAVIADRPSVWPISGWVKADSWAGL